uniref:Putative secreted protein n=1 Tax=Amblyomma triste TaxID=251400 RepID=A0A023G0T5_AMBTT
MGIKRIDVVIWWCSSVGLTLAAPLGDLHSRRKFSSNTSAFSNCFLAIPDNGCSFYFFLSTCLLLSLKALFCGWPCSL